MSIATHTPGPWRIANGDSNAILAPSPSGKTDRYVQVIYFDGGSYLYQSPGDARLIAAAPDMLAALKLCEPFCKGHQETPEKVARYRKVIDALAKAEGRS